MLNNKSTLVLLLLIVFAANYVETAIETSMHDLSAPVSAAAVTGAYAVQQFEPKFINFEYHDVTPQPAIVAYSISYFFLFPVLALAVLIVLLRREETAPARVLCLAVAVDYLLSLPWFLFFPVPERWAYPESNAMLLSDLWYMQLIQGLRPISALDNCFPSTHVSLTVIMILVCWIFDVRLRTTVTALGLTVVISTFTLGIHWLPDIIAGFFVGALSVFVGLRFTRSSEYLQQDWLHAT